MKHLIRNIIYMTGLALMLNMLTVACKQKTEVDPNGYLVFCLCMGRLGNQIETFLGTLAFAKSLNRTMVLPHWLMFGTSNVVRSFTDFFQIKPLNKYHRVIDTKYFMNIIAKEIWPPEERYLFCPYNFDACKLENGVFTNSFGYTWDRLGVRFSRIINYDSKRIHTSWNKSFPVIALMGAPAKFPMKSEHRPLAKYLQWSENIEQQGQAYIKRKFANQTFVGIHLRNGLDWQKACEKVPGKTEYFASPQCFSSDSGNKLTMDMCLPPKKEVLRLLKKVLRNTGAKIIYVATDKNPMIKEITKGLQKYKVAVFHQDPLLPPIDMYILGKSDHFIGNCISSFTSAVARERAITNKPTSFWGYS